MHNLPRALRALTSAPTNIRICSICKTKIYPLAMFQLSKLSTARNNCKNYRFSPFSPLCITEWEYASTIHITKDEVFCFAICTNDIIQDSQKEFLRMPIIVGLCLFCSASTRKTTSPLINGNQHSSIAFVLFWHQEQTQNLMKLSASSHARVTSVKAQQDRQGN